MGTRTGEPVDKATGSQGRVRLICGQTPYDVQESARPAAEQGSQVFISR